MPQQKYVIVDGAAYQPGSAAHKKALELSAAMPKPTTTTSQAAAALAPYAPKASGAPSYFPSYPTANATASGTGGPNLFGAPGMTGQGAFGLVPQVPNPIATAGRSIAGNTANLPGLTNLGTGTTTLSANLAQQPFLMNQPNYMENIGLAAANIGSNLRGEIDPYTMNQITQASAERGIRMGAPRSPNVDTNWFGVIGSTAQGLEQLGQQELNAAIARTPTGQPFNVAGQQISPTDLQAAQYASNLASAAPDPTQSAQANLDMLLRAIEAGKVGGMGGMGGYGGGGIPRTGVLSPVSAGYPGFSMPYYGGGMTTAPGWSGIVNQPFYRTTAPGADTTGTQEIPQYWPEGMPGETAGEIPQYWPEGMPNEDYGVYDPEWGDYFEQAW